MAIVGTIRHKFANAVSFFHRVRCISGSQLVAAWPDTVLFGIEDNDQY